MPPRHRMLLAGIVLLGAALRFATLDVQSYWFDEAVTVRLLRMDLFDMLGAIPDSESTPPLYYFVAWFWAQLFGTGEIGLRSLSALVGIATIPVAYAIAARAASVRAGLLAAALVAANPLLVWYSQEARAYALLVLLSALTVLVLQWFAERESGRRLAVWAALAGAALATHYFAVFVVVPEAVWLLWRLRRRALVPVGAVAAVGVALAPLVAAQAGDDRADFIRGESIWSRAASLPKQALVGYDAPGEWIATVVAAIAVVIAIYVAVTRLDHDERRGFVPLAALGALAVAVPALLSFAGVDYLITRNVLPALVPLLVAAGIALGAARAGRVGVAAGAALAVVGVAMVVGVNTDDVYQRDDWRGVAAKLGPATVDRILVVSPGSGIVPLEIYLPGARKPGRDERVPVREIDVIELSARGFDSTVEREREPTPFTLPGFALQRRLDTGAYTIVTFRSAEPRAFFDDPLYQISLGTLTELLLQPAQRP